MARFLLGRWDEALYEAEAFIAECAASPHYLEGNALQVRGQIRLARGDSDGALADFERELLLGREAKDPQALLPPLIDLAVAHATLGDVEEARRYANEALELARAHVAMSSMAARLSHVAAAIGIREELRTVVARAPNEGPLRDGALAAAEGDFEKAADFAARMGATTMEARHRLSLAEELIEAGRRTEGEAELERALAFCRSVGASFWIERGEQLRLKSA